MILRCVLCLRRLASALSVLSIFVISTAVVTAGAAFAEQPAASKQWKRLRSPNFTIAGNAADGDLRATARELEYFREALFALNPSSRPTTTPVPTFVVLFKNDDAFSRFKPRDARGRTQSSAVRPASWQATVTQFLQGRLAAEAFLTRADDNGQKTEAHFYAGVQAALANRRDEALQHFRWVKEHGSRTYIEYGFAVSELKRLERNTGPADESGRWSNASDR